MPVAQEIQSRYTRFDGLPSNEINGVAVAVDGTVYAATMYGVARRVPDGSWERVTVLPDDPVVRVTAAPNGGVWCIVGHVMARLYVGGRIERTAELPQGMVVRSIACGPDGELLVACAEALHAVDGAGIVVRDALGAHPKDMKDIRCVAARGGRVAVGAGNGLFVHHEGDWARVHPSDGEQRLDPAGVSGVAFGSDGRLAFACRDGAGVEIEGGWKLWAREDLPCPMEGCAASAEPGVVWFRGASQVARFDVAASACTCHACGDWLGQGSVQDVAVAPDGVAWIGTTEGMANYEL